jgi:hypothetical protein
MEPRAAEAVIPLAPLGPAPDSITPFATVTAMSPPVPDPAVVADILPPLTIERLPAPAVTEPALAVPPIVSDVIPVRLVAVDPSMVKAPETLTDTWPPIPLPNVPLAISPPLTNANSLAMTLMTPAFPLLVDSESVVIPVNRPFPIIVSPSPTLTKTLPPFADPKVSLEISPLLMMEMLPALTLTVPAFPMLFGLVCEEIPVKASGVIVPSIVNPPATLTETLPLLPGPKVLFEMTPELAMEMLPALTLMAPPIPVLP